MMDQFKAQVETFLATHRMKPSTFGRNFVNDPGFVFRLREGGECRPSTMDAVAGKMRQFEQEATQ